MYRLIALTWHLALEHTIAAERGGPTVDNAERKKFPVGVHLLLFNDEETLLSQRLDTGYYDGAYGLVAGHIEGDETIAEAAIREAREEIGIVISPSQIDVVGIMHRRSDEERIEFFLTARSWQGAIINNEPQSSSDVRWFNVNHLPANTIPYIGKSISLALRSEGQIWFDEPDF